MFLVRKMRTELIIDVLVEVVLTLAEIVAFWATVEVQVRGPSLRLPAKH
jgi:hypothetical protein